MSKYLHSAHSFMREIQSVIDCCCYAIENNMIDEPLKIAASRLHSRIRIPELLCNPHEIRYVEKKISFLKRILERVFR